MNSTGVDASFFSSLASFELHTNAAFYTQKRGILHCEKSFAMCLSDTVLTAFEKEGRYAAVIAEANVNARNHIFSSFMCVLSIYPLLMFTL